MKQVIQSIRGGKTSVEEVPAQAARRGSVLVKNFVSLVSAGTERMLVEFSGKSLIQKARSRPDLVRQTIDKARREGVLTTVEAVQNRLDQPLPLGYSCAGTVVDIGPDIAEFQIGDRVACAGANYAVHAEIVSVPRNLLVKIDEEVDFESAAFTTLGAIALQGIRLAEVKLGEVVAVIGLGLLGQLTVQMLKAAGCIVVGLDLQKQRADLASKAGANAVATSPEIFSTIIQQLSGGYGADAVLITADTKSNQPIELAGEIAREKGTVIVVGAVGLTIPRKSYFEKELDFRISRSNGPGRYDPEYEEKGHDYPYAYVRWTEQRNMQAFAQLVAGGKVNVQPLITHRFTIANAPEAYDLITGKTGEPFLGVLLTYPETSDLKRKVVLRSIGKRVDQDELTNPLDQVRLGVIGAGLFANAMLLPTIKKVPGIEPVGIASGSGLTSRSAGNRFGYAYCTTDVQEILKDPAINTVAILTRHHLHARQVIAALEAGKHVFVEKPLCLNDEELQAIISTYRGVQKNHSREERGSKSPGPDSPLLMVGYNRRFAPFLLELKRHLKSVQEPLMLHYRANAGFIPPDHWTQDPAQGGGRLLGEACHFIDLLIYLSGSAPRSVITRALPDSGRYSKDNLLITLEFADGTIGTVTYVANGDKGFGKESLEVFGGGLSARLEDYRWLEISHAKKRVKRIARLRQDKGHRGEWLSLVNHLTQKGPTPISFEELVLSTQATLAAQRSLQSGEPVMLG